MAVDCVSWLGSIFKHYITLHSDKYHPLNHHLMTTCRTLYRVGRGMCFSPQPFTIKSINTCLRTLNKVGLRLNQYHVGMDYMINAWFSSQAEFTSHSPEWHIQTIGPVYNCVNSKSTEGLQGKKFCSKEELCFLLENFPFWANIDLRLIFLKEIQMLARQEKEIKSWVVLSFTLWLVTPSQSVRFWLAN